MKKVYILLLIFITIFINFTVFIQQSKGTLSETEQRYLNHFEPFTFQKWVNGNIQQNIEATFMDNFYKRNEIINGLQKINTKISLMDNRVVAKINKFETAINKTRNYSADKISNLDSQELNTPVKVAKYDNIFELIKTAKAHEQKQQIKYHSVPLSDSEVSYVQELNRLIKTPEVPNTERLTEVENNIKKIKTVEERYPDIDFYIYLPLFLNDLPYFDVT